MLMQAFMIMAEYNNVHDFKLYWYLMMEWFSCRAITSPTVVENPNSGSSYQHHHLSGYEAISIKYPELYLSLWKNWESIHWNMISASRWGQLGNPSTGSAGLVGKSWWGWKSPVQFLPVNSRWIGNRPCGSYHGLERLASYIQEVDSVYDIEWADGVKYGVAFIQPGVRAFKIFIWNFDQEMLPENW